MPKTIKENQKKSSRETHQHDHTQKLPQGRGAGSCSAVAACWTRRTRRPGGRRLPVTVNGKRVKTIDVHAHCLFHEAVALMGDEASNVIRRYQGRAGAFHRTHREAAQGHGRDGDRHGGAVDQSVLVSQGSRHSPPQIVKIKNEKLAELCASKPDRFAAFASLSLQFPDLAVQQLETAVKKQGLQRRGDRRQRRGRGIRRPQVPSGLGQGGGTRRGAVHPSAEHAGARQALQGQWLAGEHHRQSARDHDRAAAPDLRGHARPFPGLKIIAAHGGGYLPSYAPRSDHACFVSPPNCNPNIKLKKKPTEYLNQLYFDALVFTPEALRHLAAQVGASQIMLGSDHPIPWEQHPVDHIFATTTLSDDEKAAILGGNAARLFGMAA